MANKQLLAQIGVFLLLGVNVAAYCFFWPRDHVHSPRQDRTVLPENGETRLVPQKAPDPPKPTEIPLAKFRAAIPLSNPSSSPDPEREDVDQMLTKLLDHINKEKTVSAPLAQESGLPAIPLPAVDPGNNEGLARSGIQAQNSAEAGKTPKYLPALRAEPVGISRPAPGLPFTPQSEAQRQSPWHFSRQAVGSRTLIVANLRDAASPKVLVEFKVDCDRVETEEQELRAIGKVALTGGGLRAYCQCLTIPLLDAKLVFEKDVQILQDSQNRDHTLRGERIVWEWTAASSIGPAALGEPK